MESTQILLTLFAIFINTQVSNGQGFRLPDTQIPSAYNIKLSFPEDIFDGTGSVFKGTTTIYFQTLLNTSSVQLHSPNSTNNINILQTSSPQDVIVVNQTVFNETTEIMEIFFDSALVENSTYELTIEYEANVDVVDRRGVFRSNYVDELGLRTLIATQFQPTYARKAFPCFDEPKYKATFNLTLSFPRIGFEAFSNTGYLSQEYTDSEKVVQFPPTPKMSTYLLAFVISNFTCTWGTNLPTSISQSVCSRRDTQSDRFFTNQNTASVISSLQTATGSTYGSQGFDKITQLAVPDFYTGAMENWGLPIYRESVLLWNREKSSDYDRQRILTMMSHELAHFWFGNLVTNEWWSDLFLNEGFATYFQYFVPANISTFEDSENWQMWRQFVVEQQQSALEADGSSSTKALSSAVETPSEIQGHFSKISYRKGAAILRMMENIMTTDTFLGGVRKYLESRAFDTAVPSDLFDSLRSEVDSLPADIDVVMQNWIHRPGYPVVTVNASGSEIRLTQKRFFYDQGRNDSTEWYIPVSYTVSTDVSEFQNVTPKTWLIPEEEGVLPLTLGNSDWIILNNQESAYYRVNYDTTLWDRIRQLLMANHQNIDVLNRAQIVDDVFNLARAGEINYSQAFPILNYLYNETDYFAWYSAVNGFEYLTRAYDESSNVASNLTKYQLYLLQNAYKVATFSSPEEGDQIQTLRSRLILNRLCRLGEENCITKVKSLYQDLRNGIRLDNNFKSVVYCNGLRYSDDVQDDWNFLWNSLQEEFTATEQQEIISALGCVRSEYLLRIYLQQALNSSSVLRKQDFSSVWSSVYSSGSFGFEVALNFFISNYRNIFLYYSDASDILSALAIRIHTRNQLARLALLSTTDGMAEDIKEVFSKAVSEAADHLEWSENRQNEIETYFLNNPIPETTYPETTTTTLTTASTPTTTTTSTTVTTLTTTMTPTTITTPTTTTQTTATTPTTTTTPITPPSPTFAPENDPTESTVDGAVTYLSSLTSIIILVITLVVLS